MVYTWSKCKILDILYIVGPRYFSREGVSALTLHPTPVPPPKKRLFLSQKSF